MTTKHIDRRIDPSDGSLCAWSGACYTEHGGAPILTVDIIGDNGAGYAERAVTTDEWFHWMPWTPDQHAEGVDNDGLYAKIVHEAKESLRIFATQDDGYEMVDHPGPEAQAILAGYLQAALEQMSVDMAWTRRARNRHADNEQRLMVELSDLHELIDWVADILNVEGRDGVEQLDERVEAVLRIITEATSENPKA